MNNFNNIPLNGNNFNRGNNGFPNGGNNGYNDYFSRININNLPRYEIIQVRGQNGAEAFQMAPNSKTLLLDENDPLIWFVETDGAGYKTVTPYQITPYQPAPPVDVNSLEARITKLEELFNAKSNITTNKSKRNNTNNTNTTNTVAE